MPESIDPATAELLTLLKFNNKSIASLGWPTEWNFNPYNQCWTKPGLKYFQNGVTVSTDYVLSHAQIEQWAMYAQLYGGTGEVQDTGTT
jgi:ABC-type glycerol-3-phosphate transport system permease component